MLHKTLVAFRHFPDEGWVIDSCYTFPWPWQGVGDAWKDLKALNPEVTIKQCIPDEKRAEFNEQMKKLSHISTGMSMRARFNNLDGPHLLEHEEEKLDDEAILSWFKSKRKAKRAR